MGLHQRYARLLQGTSLTLADTDDKHLMREQLTRLFRGMMQALFRQQGAHLDINILASDEAQQFIGTHAAVLDSSFEQVHMTETMRRRLTRCNYIFSGMKTFHELNEAFPSLLDEDGSRKPFERFLNDVRRIDETYNRHYLRAEYNFIHASAQAAARWEQFSQDGDRYHLQYRTAGDSRVRPEHADLHGVTLPPSDPFWEEFYPPNGWNCRCTVVQVLPWKHPATDRDEAMARAEAALQLDTKRMFRFNPGKQQQTVPDYNPYTISQCRQCDVAAGKDLKLARRTPPKNELCAACRLIREQQQYTTARDTYRRLKADPDYTDVHFDKQTGGVKAIHRGHTLHSSAKERTYFNGLTGDDLERRCQDQLFRMGHTAILRDESQKDSNGNYLPSLDLELDGRLMDIRSITQDNPKGYGHALRAKNRQLGLFNGKTGNTADAVCLYFHDATFYSEERIQHGINYLKMLKKENGESATIRIKAIFCVVKGENEIIRVDL